MKKTNIVKVDFTDLETRVIKDRPDYFMVTSPAYLTWLDNGVSHFNVLNTGDITNFASVPSGLRWLFNRNGKSRIPAAHHDNMYKNRRFTRKYCDQVFKAALKKAGVNYFACQSYYAAVRAFGWTRGTW